MVIKVLVEFKRRTNEYSEDFNQKKIFFFKESMRDEEYNN